MMHTVYLHGFMGQKYAKSIKLEAANLFQLMSGLVSRFGAQFKEDVRANNWHLTDGPVKEGNDLAESDIRSTLVLKRKTVHLLPAVTGESAALRIIVGVALIVVGAIYGQAWAVQLGIGLALGGVVEMLTKPHTNGPDQPKDDKGSFIYNTAINVTSQGGPIPVGYGRVQRASSVLITTDFSSDEVV